MISRDAIAEILEQIRGQTVLVVGDVMLDVYLWADDVVPVDPASVASPQEMLDALRVPQDRFSFFADGTAGPDSAFCQNISKSLAIGEHIQKFFRVFQCSLFGQLNSGFIFRNQALLVTFMEKTEHVVYFLPANSVVI